MMEFLQATEPTECIITTELPTKAPKSVGPFPAGLIAKRKMRVLLNFEKHKETLKKAGEGYFRLAPWMKEVQGPVVSNKEDNQLYLRFLFVELLSEEFFHKGEKVSKEEAEKYLPKRKPTNKPIYTAIKLQNIKEISK